jgi:hypothetical protein
VKKLGKKLKMNLIPQMQMTVGLGKISLVFLIRLARAFKINKQVILQLLTSQLRVIQFIP